MVEGFQNSNSKKTSEILERPIQQFFENFEEIVINLSIEDAFESDCIDVEIWGEILAKLWDGHFLEENDCYTTIEDILKYCMYYTGIVGRFYKVNLILSLDSIFSLLKDRLPKPDSFNVLQKLYEFAHFILMDICQKPVSRIFFYLDCHIPSVCDNSERLITLFHDVLPNNSKPALYCRIIIKYNLNDELGLTSCGYLSDIKSQASDSNKNFKDKLEESEALKEIPSPKSTDLSTKLSPESKSNDPWQKYGAKPKNKQYSVKRNSKVTDSVVGDRRFNSPESTPSVDPRLPENYRRARNCSRVAANFALNNKVIDEKGSDEYATASQESSGFSFPPPILIMENMKSFSKNTLFEDKSVNLENRRDPRLHRDYALPSCSGESTSKHFVSPSKDAERFRNLTDELVVPQNSPSKLDSDFVPFTQTPEHDLICRKFGTRIDEHGNRRCCNPLDKRRVHPANKILQSHRGALIANKLREKMDKFCLKDYTRVNLGEYEFKTDEELAEMPEGERLVHMEYEQMTIALMQSSCKLNASSSHSVQGAEAEQYENLPKHSPPPPYKQEAVEIKSTLTPMLEQDYRGLWIAYRCGMFFQDYISPNLCLDNIPDLNIILENLEVIDLSYQAAVLLGHDVQTSDHLVVKASDKVFCISEQRSLNNELSDPNWIFLQGTSADNIERSSSKNVPASYQKMPLGTAGEMFDSDFLGCIQQEIGSLTIQNEEFPDDHLEYEDTYYSSDDETSGTDDSLGHVSELEDNDEAS